MTSTRMMSTLKPREVKWGETGGRKWWVPADLIWAKPGRQWTLEVQLSRDLSARDTFHPCRGSSSLPWTLERIPFKVFPESRGQGHLSVCAAFIRRCSSWEDWSTKQSPRWTQK